MDTTLPSSPSGDAAPGRFAAAGFQPFAPRVFPERAAPIPAVRATPDSGPALDRPATVGRAAEPGFVPQGTAASLDEGLAPAPAMIAQRTRATLPFGVDAIGGLPVPEALRWNADFLALDQTAQTTLLALIESGTAAVVHPSERELDKKTVRFRKGQWPRMRQVMKGAPAYTDDGRHRLTANNLLREVLDLFFAVIAQHLDLTEVRTPEALRQALSLAFMRASRAAMNVGPTE